MQIKQRFGALPPPRAERLPALGVVFGPGKDALALVPHADALRRLAARAGDESVRTLALEGVRLALIRPRAESRVEGVWPFPCDEDYDAALESDIADVKQCTLESDADHILAARFLGRFVEPHVPWVHVDLASAANKGGLAHVPTEITGFGVRYSLSLIVDHHLLEPS